MYFTKSTTLVKFHTSLAYLNTLPTYVSNNGERVTWLKYRFFIVFTSLKYIFCLGMPVVAGILKIYLFMIHVVLALNNIDWLFPVLTIFMKCIKYIFCKPSGDSDDKSMLSAYIIKSIKKKSRVNNASPWRTPCSTLRNSLKWFSYFTQLLPFFYRKSIPCNSFPRVPNFISFLRRKFLLTSSNAVRLSTNNNIVFLLLGRFFSMIRWNKKIASSVPTPCLNPNCALVS